MDFRIIFWETFGITTKGSRAGATKGFLITWADGARVAPILECETPIDRRPLCVGCACRTQRGSQDRVGRKPSLYISKWDPKQCAFPCGLPANDCERGLLHTSRCLVTGRPFEHTRTRMGLRVWRVPLFGVTSSEASRKYTLVWPRILTPESSTIGALKGCLCVCLCLRASAAQKDT